MKQTDEKGIPMTYWGGLEEPKQETLGLKVSEETVYYQVLIVNNKGEKLAFKQNDKWTINASTEEILDQIFKTI